MKDNEFVITKNDKSIQCTTIAILYSANSSQGFIVYKEKNDDVLKVGELVNDDNDVYVEEITNLNDKKIILSEFINLFENKIN